MSDRRSAMEALDVQVNLIKFYGSRRGKEFHYNFLKSQADKEPERYLPETPSQWARTTGDAMSAGMRKALGVAPTYVLSDEMMTFAHKAGQSVPNVPFQADDPPSPTGFVVLPRPLIIPDVHGKSITARALLWWPTQIMRRTHDGQDDVLTSVIMFVAFSSKHDYEYDDYTGEVFARRHRIWETQNDYAMVHWMPLTVGEHWGPDDASMGADIHSSVASQGYVFEWLAFLKAFFLLIKQPIVLTQPEHLQRAVARQHQRLGLIPVPEVKIITLRRAKESTASSTEEGVPVNWSHRWIVEGFWRNQWYPSRERHEPVYIASFIKGPAHLPLVVKDSVFVWKR